MKLIVANESSKTNGLVVKRGEIKAPSEILALFLAANETWLQKKHMGLYFNQQFCQNLANLRRWIWVSVENSSLGWIRKHSGICRRLHDCSYSLINKRRAVFFRLTPRRPQATCVLVCWKWKHPSFGQRVRPVVREAVGSLGRMCRESLLLVTSALSPPVFCVFLNPH